MARWTDLGGTFTWRASDVTKYVVTQNVANEPGTRILSVVFEPGQQFELGRFTSLVDAQQMAERHFDQMGAR